MKARAFPTTPWIKCLINFTRYRGQRPIKKSTGLGLNFVQEVAKLHGGSLSLTNHADGGAVSMITLPK